MRVYYSMFKLRLILSFQYRVAALAGIATQFFFGGIFVMVFLAFYGDMESVNGFSKAQLTSYIWLQQAFLSFLALWMRDSELFDLIRTGNISYELCRPINTYWFWFSKLIATRLSSALLRFFPIIAFALLLPHPFKLTLPSSPYVTITFLVALFLGLIINTAISMFIYISVFKTLSPVGSLLLFSIVGEFLSGMVVPIPLMPDVLRKILSFLPFSYTGDLCFRIFSGNISPLQGLEGIITQLIWIILLCSIGNYLMNQALKNVTVQGG